MQTGCEWSHLRQNLLSQRGAVEGNHDPTERLLWNCTHERSRRPHHKHWNVRMPNQVIRDAAERDPLHDAAGVTRHHYQIHVELLGIVAEGWACRPLFECDHDTDVAERTALGSERLQLAQPGEPLLPN